MNGNTINKKRIEQQFRKSISTYNKQAYIQDNISKNLINFLTGVCGNKFPHTLEIGAGTGLLTEKLLSDCEIKSLTINDLVPEMQIPLTDICGRHDGTKVQFEMGDAEKIPFPKLCDLIISASTIQWFENLHDFFIKCHTSLNNNGILAISTFGCLNMKEVQCITGKALQYPSIEDYKTILSKYFDILVLEETQLLCYFKTPAEVLHHIKETGVNGIDETRWTKKNLFQFTDEYQRFHNTTNGYELSYHPIYIICKKKKII